MTINIYSSNKEVENYQEWIKPAVPEWFKELQVKVKKEKPTMENPFNGYSSGCPSFVELFKNSYMLCAPHDIMFRFVDDNVESHGTSDFMYFGKHNLGEQMHPYFGDKYYSIKVMLKTKVTSDVPMKMMYLHPQYETRSTFPATVINGVVPLVPGAYVELNTNMIIEQDKIPKQPVFIEKGTPLSYIYFPEGKPKIKVTRCTEEDFYRKYFNPKSYFSFNYIKSFLSKGK